MIYFFLFYATRNFINTTSDGIFDLLLHLEPTEYYEIEVEGGTETFFSDITKAKGVSIEVETSDDSVFGPFDYTSHISGISFRDDLLYNSHLSGISSYKIKIFNEEQSDIRLAMVFLGGYGYEPLVLLDFLYSGIKFPYSSSQSDKYSFFFENGIIFYEKKFSNIFLFVSIGIIALQFIVIICCCCQR